MRGFIPREANSHDSQQWTPSFYTTLDERVAPCDSSPRAQCHAVVVPPRLHARISRVRRTSQLLEGHRDEGGCASPWTPLMPPAVHGLASIWDAQGVHGVHGVQGVQGVHGVPGVQSVQGVHVVTALQGYMPAVLHGALMWVAPQAEMVEMVNIRESSSEEEEEEVRA